MAKTYKSKPHEIQAFRFTTKDRDHPSWFIEAVHTGKAALTIRHDARYITVYGKNQLEKAYDNDWICLSGHGKIYVLCDSVFKEYYG